MTFPTIRIEGAILSADILDTIAQGEGAGQTAENFGLAKTTKTKDEIARAWADALDYWRIFKRKLDQASGFGTTETRKFWAVPLLNLLGYDPALQAKGEEVQGRNYVISHRDRAQFPIHIVGWRGKLDEKPQAANGPKLSPHGLLQEYINLTEHVYALVTNGSSLRLLRDGSRLIRLSYVEFDLERMMDEEIYADFAVLYRLLHASRMPATPEQTPESWIERYHQDALESGSRIRDGLSFYVKEAIERFANGLLQHPANTHLRDQITTGQLSADAYYQHLLRLIYRLLFLMVTEERNIIYDAEAIKTNSALKRLKGIYDQYYSLARLRRLAEQRHVADGRFMDLWTSLLDTFRLFEDGAFGQALGITPLGGRLFGIDALGPLHQCALDNRTLLECLLKLSLFKHPKTGQRIRVNYAALNVEEFGSVYEGLLELDATIISNGKVPIFSFVKGEGRGRSGSHYTPEELVQPLIKHSLDYLIADKLKQPDKQQALLSLKILDPACGSGHILLSAARRLATELARVLTNEDQPNPVAYRTALRDVVRNCIYGVDKNPAAVELCKVALWLESHTPGEPLGFLDHRIRCGDSIVGLISKSDRAKGISNAAFKALQRDDKQIASSLLKRNKDDQAKATLSLYKNQTDDQLDTLVDEYEQLLKLPERNPAEVEAKTKAFEQYEKSSSNAKQHALADLAVAPFFIPKSASSVSNIITDGPYREMLRGYAGWQIPAAALAKAVSTEKRFFHWYLEFKEVFNEKSGEVGFDCVLGNPPFMGYSDLSGSYGNDYLQWLRTEYAPAGAVDLVTYFFRRAFNLIKPGGFQSLIATNTISQGGAREGGLDVIMTTGGNINHAVKSMKWPGNAAVEVALVTLTKQPWKGPFVLADKEVSTITTYLDDAETTSNPYQLAANKNKSFFGSMILGMGFTMNPESALIITQSNPKYKDVIFPYLNGDDLNNNFDQSPSRYVVNFFDWPLRRYTVEEWSRLSKDLQEKIIYRLNEGSFETIAPPNYKYQVAADYPACLNIVERLVKPERDVLSREVRKDRWWQYGEKASGLYSTILKSLYVFVVSETTKYLSFVCHNKGIVFSKTCKVVTSNSLAEISILSSCIHESWVRKYCSTLETRLKYNTSVGFETFPFPTNIATQQEAELKLIGEQYHEHRRQLMLGMQLGLTKTYNLFHSQPLRPATAEELALDDKPFEKVLGKEAAHLHKHLARTHEATLTFNEAVTAIERLRVLHIQMDTAVRNAYGWQDLELGHSFHEVDYLPENDRVRYTISPAARREVLKRLLLLNHKLYAEEQAEKAAQIVLLTEAKATLKRGKAASSTTVQEPDAAYKLVKPDTVKSLGIDFNTNMKEFGLHQGIYSVSDAATMLDLPTNKVRDWFRELVREGYEGLSDDQRVDAANRRISFHGLIELYVIGKLRDDGVPIRPILNARADLKDKTGKQYPFATNNVKDRLRTDGRRIYFYFEGDESPVTLDGSGQFNLNLIKLFFDAIEFNTEGIAQRMFPARGNRKVVIDPKQGNGKPVIVNKEVLVNLIASIYDGPESLTMLAEEYNLNEEEVKGALNYAQVPL